MSSSVKAGANGYRMYIPSTVVMLWYIRWYSNAQLKLATLY